MNFKFIPPTNIRENQLNLWNSILRTNVNLNQRFKNNSRSDTKAGAILRMQNGVIRLFDPSSQYHSMTIWEVIEKEYPKDNREKRATLLLKGKHFKKHIIKEKKKCDIKFSSRKWNFKDKEFWNGKTLITGEQLKNEKVYPVKDFWFTKEGIWKKMSPKWETYGNFIQEKIKIYTPKGRFWISNVGNKIGGYKKFNSNKTLYLTKNLKSYMVLCNLGLNSRYVPSEGVNLPKDTILKWNELFDEVVCIMDNDLAGILANDLLELQWIKICNNKKLQGKVFPNLGSYTDAFNQIKLIKDPYDICKAFSIKRLDNEIRNL